MKIKFYLPLFIFLFNISLSNSQERITAEFNQPTQAEFDLTSYEYDTKAPGVVLYEKGNYYMKSISGEIKLIKEVHRKIKVFDAKKFNSSEVDIYYYHKDDKEERVLNIEALTHNIDEKTFVDEKNIYTIDESTNWSKKSFTFPNIKDGSILEYKYTITSSFFFNFGKWNFQHELPTIYSDFQSKIPGNYLYRRSLIGSKKLDISETYIQKNCFNIDDIRADGDCEVSIYVMFNVPAFLEEDYMLSSINYISSIQFELQELIYTNGVRHKFSKEWKDVDKEFRFEYNLGRQLKFKSFFKGKMPENILTISESLEKAKNIYKFIHEHYTLIGTNNIFSENSIKNAFNTGKGTNSEINLSLINSLNAAGLDAKLVLLATRNNKLPTKDYPIISEFNYVIALLTVNNKEYLLDASSKYCPFGILPLKALNRRGRVMDFNNDSYWIPLEPYQKNISYTIIQSSIDNENQLTGNVESTYTGYSALEERELIASISKKEYLDKKESFNLEVTNHLIENENNINEHLKEKFSFNQELETVSDKIILNPFILNSKFLKNPFNLESRNYTIDFGYPFEVTYLTTIDLNNSYEVLEIPKSRSFKLPQDTGSCSVIYKIAQGKVMLKYKLHLKNYEYHPEAYSLLKEFFMNIVDVLTKDTILLKKI